MKIFAIKPNPADDYNSIKRNGMWYLHWQAGYSDILKKGYPKPKDDETILAELHSPNVDDFLHGSSAQVPFIISEKAKSVFENNNLTGFRYANVQIVKIATKGKKNRKSKSGEPEDAILKSKNKLGEVTAPNLFAVYVTGQVNSALDYPSGRSPVNWVSPFNLEIKEKSTPDLFRPYHGNEPFSAWVFCSEFFVNAVSEAELTNITFEPFDIFMGNFREDTKQEIQKRRT
jgi:hypothetical protein